MGKLFAKVLLVGALVLSPFAAQEAYAAKPVKEDTTTTTEDGGFTTTSVPGGNGGIGG